LKSNKPEQAEKVGSDFVLSEVKKHEYPPKEGEKVRTFSDK